MNALFAAFIDELQKLAQGPKMRGVPEAMQSVLRRQAAKTHALAGSPPPGFKRKKVSIGFPKSRAQAQQLSGQMGKFITKRTV